MVVGLDIFREFFKDYTDCYIIIGGTACDISLSDAGFAARATDDIDIVLIVEALTPEFGAHFWKFVEEAGYEQRESSPEKLEYFRFLRPKNANYPQQLELFARKPELFSLPEGARLRKITLDDDVISLSAILMDEAYYQFTLDHSSDEESIHRATTEALIVLKAKAFLDLTRRKAKGENVSSRNIKKHKTDVFLLALLLTADHTIDLPESIAKDLREFLDTVKEALPPPALFKEKGAGSINPQLLYAQLKKTFGLE